MHLLNNYCFFWGGGGCVVASVEGFEFFFG